MDSLAYLWERFEHTGSIFYWPYLLVSFGMMFAARAVFAREGPRGALRTMFPRRVWLGRSGRVDLISSVVYVMVFDVPLGAAQVAVFNASYSLLKRQGLAGVTPPFTLALPVPVEAGLAALVLILSYDFATYVTHWLSHRFPILWDLHAVHHSVEELNLFSIYRDHPADHLIRNAARGLFTGTALAVLHFFLPQATSGATVLGIGVGFFVYLLTVHLHHSHIPVRYPRWLRYVIMSPHIHQLHHSTAPQHIDRNYGVIFPYWDRLFGTYVDEDCDTGTLRFGLVGEDPFRHSYLRCSWYPFYAMGRRVRGWLRREAPPPSSKSGDGGANAA